MHQIAVFEKRCLGLYILSIFSCYYINKIAFSPFYIFFIFGALLFVLDWLSNSLILNNGVFRSDCIFLFFCTPLVFLNSISYGSKIQDCLNFAVGPVVYIMVKVYCDNVTSDTRMRVSIFFIYSSLFLILIETIIRFFMPDLVDISNIELPLGEELFFYKYKFSSIMYEDSNFVGLQLVVVAAFLITLRLQDQFQKLKFTILSIVIIALTYATFSRASSITVTLLYFAYLVRNFGGFSRFLLFGFCLVFSSVYFEQLLVDESLLSKFYIFNVVVDYLVYSTIPQILLGVGIGNGVDVLGMGAHNLSGLLILEAGALYTIFFLSFSWHRFRNGAAYIVASIFINGISLVTFAIPFYYVALALASYKISNQHND